MERPGVSHAHHINSMYFPILQLFVRSFGMLDCVPGMGVSAANKADNLDLMELTARLYSLFITGDTFWKSLHGY
jgi:hypothetical protein